MALINPAPEAPFLSGDFVRRCLDSLAERGYQRAITGALSPLEQAGFLAAGFAVEERLRLLTLDLETALMPAAPPGFRLRRVPKHHREDVLVIDRAAFPHFWRFDRNSLEAALHATPSVRFRVAVGDGGRWAGYGICGRSGGRGFVQRLAVHPGLQRNGTGRRLLMDGLAWMRRHGVKRVLVNTQASNLAALSLYEDVGFKEEPVGLSVLSAGLA